MFLITYYHTCALLIFINVSILFQNDIYFPRGEREETRKLIYTYESQGLVRKFKNFQRFREIRVNHGRTFRIWLFMSMTSRERNIRGKYSVRLSLTDETNMYRGARAIFKATHVFYGERCRETF